MQEALAMDGAVDFSSMSGHSHVSQHTPGLSAFSTTTNLHHHHPQHAQHHFAQTTHHPYAGQYSGGSVHGHSSYSLLHSAPSSLATSSLVLGVKEEKDAVNVDNDNASEVDYVNSRCVIFTFYSEELDKVVDDHFSRSLNHQNNLSGEGSSKEKPNVSGESCQNANENRRGIWFNKNGCQIIPMIQRHFPPSFWNANLYSGSATSTNNVNHPMNLISQTNAGGAPLSHRDVPMSSYLPAATATDPYNMRTTAAMHTQPDAWHYGYPHQPAAYAHHHAGFHELGYGVSSTGSAFSPRYSSLLIQPAVRPGRLPTIPGQCEYSKSSCATEGPPTYTPHSHQSTDQPCYSTESGTTPDSHETNKDLFWF